MNDLMLLGGIEKTQQLIENIVVPPQKFLTRQPIQSLNVVSPGGLTTAFSASGAGVLELLYVSGIDPNNYLHLIVDGVTTLIRIDYYEGDIKSGHVNIVDNQLLLNNHNAVMNNGYFEFIKPMQINFAKSLEIKFYIMATRTLNVSATYSLYK